MTEASNLKPLRFVLETNPIDESTARQLRDQEIQSREDEIRYKLSEIEDMKASLLELKQSPIPTELTKYVTIDECDPRYENAEIGYSPRDFHGSWKFTPSNVT